MSDEKKETTEESEEVKETSEETDEKAETSEGSASEEAVAGSDASDAEADSSAEVPASEPGDVEAAMDREAEEPPAAVTKEKEEIVTEELDREDLETVDTDREAEAAAAVSHDDEHAHDHHPVASDVLGVAAFFDHPDHLLFAASKAREAEFADFDAYSPFPIHGMDDAMGLGRSWIPWVTFLAGCAGFSTATMIEFGIMGYDWPMVFGGKPFIAWPSFVPVQFELTVLFAGVTTAIVMLAAAGCFRKPLIIDPEITNDRFVLWISANDPHFSTEKVIEFMRGLNPMEIRTLKKDAAK